MDYFASGINNAINKKADFFLIELILIVFQKHNLFPFV